MDERAEKTRSMVGVENGSTTWQGRQHAPSRKMEGHPLALSLSARVGRESNYRCGKSHKQMVLLGKFYRRTCLQSWCIRE